MKKKLIFIGLLLCYLGINAQEKLADKAKRVKVDGVAVVVGKNIVLDSDIDKFKKELKQRSEGKVDISDCKILEEIMMQKLLAHHAVVDSMVVADTEVNSEVERTIAYFTQQLGSMDKVLDLYGFNNEADLRGELYKIQKEQMLIGKERASITDKMDVTPEEVRTYYNNLKESNNLPEFGAEIELAQIVRTIEPSKAETKRVVDKLNKIRNDIENGFSFRLKAIINSDDPAVSGNGPGSGGLYTLTRQSNFIKEFKDVAFSLDEGEVSEPFKSSFGWHILEVEKIKGQERDVRHILIQPKISPEELQATKDTLASIRQKILDKKITFDQAVLKYSDDKETKNNKGLILNPQTNDTHFSLTRMDPTLYGRISNLKAGEITQPFYDEVRGGAKMFKILLVKSKNDAHIANFNKDYEKIQQLTLEKKKEEAIDKWAKEKIVDTYIKINKDFKKCKFKNNWKKE